jgi:hypothetical protein
MYPDYKEDYKYIYEGPVLEYGRLIANNWKGETTAPSEAKAKSNLAYQFKKQNGRFPSAKITLVGKIRKVG